MRPPGPKSNGIARSTHLSLTADHAGRILTGRLTPENPTTEVDAGGAR